jgi:uncharacterized protein (DUF58 family)
MAERFKVITEQVLDFFRWFYRYRSIRFTPEGTRFILLTLAVGVAALNTGNNLLYLLLAMLLSLIVMSGVLSEQCLKHLAIRRRVPAHIFAGRPTTASISIVNRKPRLSSFSLQVMDVVQRGAVDLNIHLLHLPPRASVTRPYSLQFARRGLHRIEGVKLLTRFPFGLITKAATLPLETDLVVYPAPRLLPDDLIHELTALGQDNAAFRRGQGTGLHNLREYLPGDDSRAIHWKTSARFSQLVVRETEAEDQRQATVALPTAGTPGRPDDFEQAVVVVASLAAWFLERDFTVRALVGDDEIPHGTGATHLHLILRTLALCRADTASAPRPVSDAFLLLRERTALGELAFLVLPWPDPSLLAACRGVSGVLKAWDAEWARS